MLLGLASAQAQAPMEAGGYRIDAYVIGNGGALEASSARYRLRATTGQPVIGYSSGGGYELSAGFWTGRSVCCADRIFINGFEETPAP